jgi:hypothetical protein
MVDLGDELLERGFHLGMFFFHRDEDLPDQLGQHLKRFRVALHFI